jgi:hypothetical protein
LLCGEDGNPEERNWQVNSTGRWKMSRKMMVSFGIIAVLLLLIALKNWKSSPDLPELTNWKESAGEIVIKNGESTITLSLSDEKWLINGKYPADKNAVTGLEKKIKEMEVQDLISRKEFYTKYDLTPEKAVSVTVNKGGRKLRELLIGKKSSTNRHTYMRIDGKPGVYLVAGTFDREVNKTVDELRDKEILNIGKDSIEELEISYRGRSFLFAKKLEEKKPEKGAVKKGEKDKPAKPEKVEKWICKGYPQVKISTQKMNPLLSGFSPLRASTFLEMEKSSLGKPLGNVKIKAFNKEVSVSFHKQEKEKKYIAASSESPYVFTLDEWRVKKFLIENIEGLKE